MVMHWIWFVSIKINWGFLPAVILECGAQWEVFGLQSGPLFNRLIFFSQEWVHWPHSPSSIFSYSPLCHEPLIGIHLIWPTSLGLSKFQNHELKLLFLMHTSNLLRGWTWWGGRGLSKGMREGGRIENCWKWGVAKRTAANVAIILDYHSWNKINLC